MKNSDFTLRKLGEGDLDRIMELQEAVLSELTNEDHLRRNPPENFERCFHHPSTTIGLFDGEELAGMSIIAYEHGNPEDLAIGLEKYEVSNLINMKSVMIRKKYYGMGFQRSIMRIMERLSWSMGFREMAATVSPENEFSRSNIIKSGYLYDHTAVKYNGMLRDVFVRYIDMKELEASVTEAIRSQSSKPYRGELIFPQEKRERCYFGDLSIATTGDIAEFRMLSSGETYYGLLVKKDTDKVLTIDPSTGNTDLIPHELCLKTMELVSVRIDPER